MILGILFCLSMRVASAISAEMFRDFDISLVNSSDNTIPNDGLLQPISLVSELQCGVECITSKSCVAFFYNMKARECHLYRGGLNTTPRRLLTQIGTRHYRMNRGLVGDNCFTASDCQVEHSECRSDGCCGCVAGYSFKQSTHSCEASCIAYGDTFQDFQYHIIYQNDVKSVPVETLDQCMQSCLQASDYTCISFDFRKWGCYHKAVDALDAPTAYRYDKKYTHFRRNCA